MSDELELFPAAPVAASASPTSHPASGIARVFVDVPLRRAFDYAIPLELRERVSKGSRVLVPFHGRKAVAFVSEIVERSEVPVSRLKSIARVLDERPAVTEEILSLASWVSSYYACGPGEALAAAVPHDVGTEEKKTKRSSLDLDAKVELAPGFDLSSTKRMGEKQRRILAALANAGGSLRSGDLLRIAEADRASLERLRERGALSLTSTPREESEPEVGTSEPPPPVLTGEQESALAPILEDLSARRFQATLLFGVTGSGKTEVYLRAIARSLELGRGAIVLVPEIALTPQTERRFRGRFGSLVAVLHSRQGGRARAREWKRVRDGSARVVVGPRSAVWAPVRDLGVVVIDEEHDPSYKQESSPRYHARDTAIMRARAASAPVILGSATPSLESWQNATEGKYRLARLRGRPGGALLPRCDIVDIAREWTEVRAQPLFSRALELSLKEAFERGERAIVFLNRRGFTTFLHCPQCGHVQKCPQCDIALAFHKREAALLCHFCYHRAATPRGPCPACLGPPLRQRGSGTEKVEEVFRTMFPGVTTVRLDSDALAGGVTPEDVLRRFRDGSAQVLIGTQMVAKGLDVPEVTVVGVVSADTGLSHPDFRSAERTFQLVAQVAGRAGRGARPGRTVIQTFNPLHDAIALAAKHDFETFAARELESRAQLGYPPFGRLLKVLWRSPSPARVEAEAEAAVADLKDALSGKEAAVLGPAPSPRRYLAGKHRWQALVKARSPGAIKAAVGALEARGGDKAVEMALDVDPVSLL
ncbi:primosomal protein N' [bacterium]|nr:primosomal protein N' [bacterium]